MPCKILSILVDDGERMNPGDRIMITESMKMEVSINAETAGIFSYQVEGGRCCGRRRCSLLGGVDLDDQMNCNKNSVSVSSCFFL